MTIKDISHNYMDENTRKYYQSKRSIVDSYEKQKEIAEIANIVFDRIKIEISNKAVIPIEEIGNALDKALDGKKGIKIQL